MNLLDRAIEVISPRWAAERKAWRTFNNSYNGGIPTRDSEFWTSGTVPTRFGSSQDRQQVLSARQRAYNAYDNNPVAKSIIDTETDNVIGDGLNYKPTTDSEAWNREAVDKYWQWLENATVRGSDIMSGCEAERMIWSRSRLAGDIGWALINRSFVDRDTGVLTVGSRIQIIDAENIVTPDRRLSDLTIRDGIQYDEFGAPSSFFILGSDPETGKRDFVEIAARDFVYLPHMTKVNQGRPPSAFGTIFDLLSHLDRYVDGVSLAAWMGTVIGLIFKQANSAKQLNALPTLTNSQGNPQAAITLENGLLKFVGGDDDVVQVNAHQPMQQTPDFIDAMMRLLGMAFDMPLEVIAKNMSKCTFASARIGLLPFYRSCRIKAARFSSRWSRTIQWWLSRERLRSPGDPKRWVNEFPENYWSHNLLVNAWDYTDPVSEAQGDLLQIDMGIKSHQMVINERGRDAELILRDREEWAAKTVDLPQVHSTMTRDPAPDPTEQPAQPDPKADPVKAYARALQDMKDEAEGLTAE